MCKQDSEVSRALSPDSMAMPLGAFGEPRFSPPVWPVYEDRMQSWVVMPNGIKRMA